MCFFVAQNCTAHPVDEERKAFIALRNHLRREFLPDELYVVNFANGRVQTPRRIHYSTAKKPRPSARSFSLRQCEDRRPARNQNRRDRRNYRPNVEQALKGIDEWHPDHNIAPEELKSNGPFFLINGFVITSPGQHSCALHRDDDLLAVDGDRHRKHGSESRSFNQSPFLSKIEQNLWGLIGYI
jgi:hypothetical protein